MTPTDSGWADFGLLGFVAGPEEFLVGQCRLRIFACRVAS